MKIAAVTTSALRIPFHATFRHAAAELDRTQTLWLQLRSADGAIGHGEGCPREYVTGEDLAGTQHFVECHREEWRETIDSLDTLSDWIKHHRTEIDAHPAAWTAFELAVLDLLGQETSRPVAQLLGRPAPEGRFVYSAVLGDSSSWVFDAQLKRYLEAGFRNFNIKLSGDLARDRTKIVLLADAGIDAANVRADANNLWRDADSAIEHLRALQGGFSAIEEPLRPGDLAGMRRIADACGLRIVLDESVSRIEHLDALAADPQRWIINLRVSKMGGLLRSLALVDAARELGLRLVVGSHVGETSVLTRAALCAAQAAGELLVAQEGAFGTHLLQYDVTEPPLMFGLGGVLDTRTHGLARKPGWGLAIHWR
jgi:L-alanine-DL-glutamate epimerase-like enolase superfamily enzyme